MHKVLTVCGPFNNQSASDKIGLWYKSELTSVGWTDLEAQIWISGASRWAFSTPSLLHVLPCRDNKAGLLWLAETGSSRFLVQGCNTGLVLPAGQGKANWLYTGPSRCFVFLIRGTSSGYLAGKLPDQKDAGVISCVGGSQWGEHPHRSQFALCLTE